MKWLKKFEIFQKKEPKVSREFNESLYILNWTKYKKAIIGFSKFVMLFSFLVFILLDFLVLFVGWNISIFIILTIIVPILLNHYITEYPKIKANNMKLESLTESPEVLMNLIISLKQGLNLEKSILFATENNRSLLAKDLKKLVWKIISGYNFNLNDELNKLALKWGKVSFGLKRALYMIRESLTERNQSKRNSILDKALNLVLKDLINKSKEYNLKLYVPTLVLFSMGTIFPLVIISLIPVTSFLGLNISNPINIFLFLTLSLVFLFFYSENLIKNRPFAFSSLSLPEKKYKLLKKYEITNSFIISLFLFLVFPGILYLFTLSKNLIFNYPLNYVLDTLNTFPIIWGIGTSLSIYFYVSSKPLIDIRNKTLQMESELPDVSFYIANKLSEGISPERAIVLSQNMLKDFEINKLFKSIAKKLYQKNLKINEAIELSLDNIHSLKIKSFFNNFKQILKKGTLQASRLLFSLTNYLNEIKDTQNELKESLHKTVSMMRTTALFFSPIIAGLIIRMFEIIKTSMANIKETSIFSFIPLNLILDVTILQLMLGVYIIFLGIILIRFISKINNGNDNVILKYELSKSIPIILLIYSFTIILSKVIL